MVLEMNSVGQVLESAAADKRLQEQNAVGVCYKIDMAGWIEGGEQVMYG